MLVSVEPVGAPEHREEKDNERLISDGLPKPHDLGLPARVLHQHYLGVVWPNNVVGIAKKKGENSADEHQNDETDVSTISDSACGLLVDVLAQWNLRLLVKFKDKERQRYKGAARK